MCPLTQGWTSAIWSEAFDAVQMFIFRSRGTKRWSSECKMFLMPSRRLVSHPQSSFSGKCPAGFHWFHSKKKRKKSLGTLFPHGYISKILVSQWNMNQVMRKSWISGSASQDPWSQHLSGYTRRHFLFSQAFGTGSKHHPSTGHVGGDCCIQTTSSWGGGRIPPPIHPCKILHSQQASWNGSASSGVFNLLPTWS